MLEQFNEIIDLFKSNIYILAAFYVLLSFILARIVDKVIIAIIKKAVQKSKTDLDDKLVDIFHTPIYKSILFLGKIMSN